MKSRPGGAFFLADGVAGGRSPATMCPREP